MVQASAVLVRRFTQNRTTSFVDNAIELDAGDRQKTGGARLLRATTNRTSGEMNQGGDQTRTSWSRHALFLPASVC